ncbi:hypothetical protein LSTR_LSTR008607 [Laodelphax striatellus]|uniref:Uncharacterized protein n=1 Tax=Laodelphax striatellus TaxID=195883 RepID=A0A482WZK7_LAOST|nr:hypothetical protein LSTR_LSTR008607 [Laodelphax striatellus]
MSGGGGGGGGVDVANLIQEWLASQLTDATCVSSSWTVGKSKFGGRGLFATRDIQPSELIFVDIPIILAPYNVALLFVERQAAQRSQCVKSCMLHVSPAGRLRQATPTGDTRAGVAATRRTGRCRRAGDTPPDTSSGGPLVTPRRSPNDSRRIAGPRCVAAETLRQVLGTRLTREQEEWMVQCCRAMDTNAFETVQVPHQLRQEQHKNGSLAHEENASLENGGDENGSVSRENGSLQNGVQENGSLSHENGSVGHVNGSLENGVHENGHENGEQDHENGSLENGQHKNEPAATASHIGR